jgi:hypothetical protein
MPEQKKEAHFVNFLYFEGIIGNLMASGELGTGSVGRKGKELFIVHFTSNYTIIK